MSAHVTDEQLSQLADGELSLVARRAVLDHVAACPACAARHDALVDLVATLRLEPMVAWTDEATAAAVERAAAPTGARDRALPLAAMLAVAGIALAALSFPLIEAAARVGFRLGSTAVAVVSHQVGVSVLALAGIVAVLAVAVATLPLARWR
jgi:anti-sigma factor RsiW